MNSTVLSTFGDSQTWVVSVLISFFSILIAVSSLNVAKKAQKATNHNLLLSIYMYRRQNVSESLTYFYYPLSQFLTGREDISIAKEGVQRVIDLMLFDAGQHNYLDPDIGKELDKLLALGKSAQKSDFELLEKRVDGVAEQKKKEFAEWTKKIEELGDEWIL